MMKLKSSCMHTKVKMEGWWWVTARGIVYPGLRLVFSLETWFLCIITLAVQELACRTG